jgi:hypothetical protein
MDISKDFISKEQRDYKFKIGSVIASSLTGFLVGAIVASTIWAIGFDYMSNAREAQCSLEQVNYKPLPL